MLTVSAAFCVTAALVALQLDASFPDGFVDRSSQNLSSVPEDLPQAAEFVDLSHNHIRQLRHGDFKHTYLLRSLNMSWNILEEIDPQTFLDTPNLEELDLSYNKLKNLSNQRYLLHTENLRVLNLTSNQFLSMALGSEFSSLVNLESLALGAKNICMNDFQSITAVKLHTLSLHLEDYLNYEAGSLKLVKAKKLQIAFTSHPRMHYDLLADALLVFAELELINLADGLKDLIQPLRDKAEIHTSHLQVTNMSVTWEDLTDTVNVLLSTSIAHISAIQVTLSRLPQKETEVAKTSQVKSFTASQVEVTTFLFSQEAVYDFFINMPVESLAVTETSIIHMTCPKSQSPLLHLDFSFCALTDSIFSRVENQKTVECENLGNLRTLNLLGNNLKSLGSISKRLGHMTLLKDLDLSLNSLVYDGLENCEWPPNITNLILSSNGLTGSVFNCLPAGTETLDLENNKISVLPLSIIKKLSNLLSLNLNQNRLRDLPGCNGFPYLNTLFLRFNSLSAPSVNKLENCSELKTLDVGFNPYTCTCDLKSFISLGITAENKKSHSGIELLGWPADYHCTYPEVDRDTTLNVISIPEIYCNTGLLAATILGPSVALLILIVSLCHYWDVPWYLKMIGQWTRAKHRARREVRPEDMVGTEFHAFVSYSQHDAKWVHNSLLPNLEGPAGGLRICHHERHFVPGKTIVENIITCVEKCRRSVFVLSAHFVKSEWCHYELYFASHQHLTRGSDSVVLVLLEPLPQYLIPSKYNQLKSMMSRHTYLEWPHDRAKHRLFWANLRAALQCDLPDAAATELQE
ncbi:LOW QUALITY PROTEIN: toll-like receptor 1 [Xyrichtys novacula]|uniref:LOW QUALITY PROTEIN: toll-like receptor 1 n=1 Tax=Xyrichtys novacula TaxID=13765 RepID=A0AAV1FCT5_XYRNO|nr:LOW QUALITY PROTEIN: toll-like receptor 1 [Xyrichtys novacula]